MKTSAAFAVAASRRLVAQAHSRHRYFSSQVSSSSNSSIKQFATFAAAGGLVYGAFFFLQPQVMDTSVGPVPALTKITERVFFDVNIDNEPAGRIVMGLFGNVVPKTCKNFETLCKGDQWNGKKRLSYERSSFHRVIPGKKR